MIPGGRRLCERGVHNVLWIGEPEHDADTDTWWVMTRCRVCGHQERVDVTGSSGLALWQFGQARDAAVTEAIEAFRRTRLAMWLARKLNREDGGR